MVSGLGVFLDAEATLVFFFWEPKSSLDFLFLLVTSAILRIIRKKCEISTMKFTVADGRTSRVAKRLELEGRFPNFFWPPPAGLGSLKIHLPDLYYVAAG